MAGKVTVIHWSDDADACLAALQAVAPPDLRVTPACPGLRVRHVRKAGFDWYSAFQRSWRKPIDMTVEY